MDSTILIHNFKLVFKFNLFMDNFLLILLDSSHFSWGMLSKSKMIGNMKIFSINTTEVHITGKKGIGKEKNNFKTTYPSSSLGQELKLLELLEKA